MLLENLFILIEKGKEKGSCVDYHPGKDKILVDRATEFDLPIVVQGMGATK